MPLDPDAVGFASEPVDRRWTSKDCMLYALGVGAGVGDLAYTTENTQDAPQKAYPTMAVVLGSIGRDAWKAMGKFSWARLVHGGEDVEIHRAIPVEGQVSTVTEIVGMYDKGKAAIVEIESRSSDAESGEPMFTTRRRLFIRGEGGFGDDRGTPRELPPMPEGDPDQSWSASTFADQALVYRLSGDPNPLHSDPAFAAKAGFDQPILHGLCTYGITGRLLLRGRCDDDPARFGSMSARFASPVFPGDELIVDVWESTAGDRFRTRRVDGTVVLDDGLLTPR